MIYEILPFLKDLFLRGKRRERRPESLHGVPPLVDFTYHYPVNHLTLDNGIRIAYIDEGSGNTTLLMLHGLGSYLPAWRKNVDELRTYFRCIALDLPNYGKSSRGAFPFSMSFFAETVREVVQKLGLTEVVLVGHSMGGQVAVTTLLQTDVPVKKLILVAPAGFETFSEKEKDWIMQLAQPEVIEAFPQSQIKRNFALNFSDNRLPDDARFMFDDRMRMQAIQEEYRYYSEMIPKCVQSMLDEPIFNRLSQISVPTLILFGRQDWLIPNRLLHPARSTEQIAMEGHRQIKNSRLEILSPGGHFLQWEAAHLVNKRILSFCYQD